MIPIHAQGGQCMQRRRQDHKSNNWTVQGATQPTQSSVITTTTASHNPDTSARPAEGIGQKVGPSETSQLEVVPGRTRRSPPQLPHK